MNKTRLYAVNQFKKHFNQKKSTEYEQALFDLISELYSDQNNFDYIKFNRNYSKYLANILENLEYNHEFKKVIKDNSFSNVLEMNVTEWAPLLYESFKFKSEMNNEIREGQFKCNNCAKNKDYYWNTTYYELQTRSSDEPMTIFITCQTCKKKWKTS